MNPEAWKIITTFATMASFQTCGLLANSLFFFEKIPGARREAVDTTTKTTREAAPKNITLTTATMMVMVWILQRLGVFMMMHLLDIPMTWTNAAACLIAFNVVDQLVRIGTWAVSRMLAAPDRLKGPLELGMVMNIATLVVATGGILIVTRIVATIIQRQTP